MDFWQQGSCGMLTGLELFLSRFCPHMLISASSRVSLQGLIYLFLVFDLRSYFSSSLNNWQHTQILQSCIDPGCKCNECATWGCLRGRRSVSSGPPFVFCHGCCVMETLILDRRVCLCHLKQYTPTEVVRLEEEQHIPIHFECNNCH